METIPKLAAFQPRKIESYMGESKICSFYEDLGMDANKEYGRRWRVVFYYEPHLALTKFFQSEAEKDRFLLQLNPEEKHFEDWRTKYALCIDALCRMAHSFEPTEDQKTIAKEHVSDNSCSLFADDASTGNDCVLQISMSGSREAILSRLREIVNETEKGKPCQGIICQFHCTSHVITPVWGGQDY